MYFFSYCFCFFCSILPIRKIICAVRIVREDHQKTGLAVFLKPCCPSKLFELAPAQLGYNQGSDFVVPS